MRNSLAYKQILTVIILAIISLFSLQTLKSTNPQASTEIIQQTHPLHLIATPVPTLTLDSYVYLPIAFRDCGINAKVWTGVHLGNRIDDWPVEVFKFITPGECGNWPAMVVVLSNQVYNLERYPATDPDFPCRIYGATVGRPQVFEYLKQAAQAGTRIVIRIYPSPGNFEDWDQTVKDNHNLITYPPVGPDGYCNPTQYRTIGDIGDEMGAIHNFNMTEGFSEFAFEPANEPNTEWYHFQTTPARNQVQTWVDMDVYFSALYDYVHANYTGTMVLTPPMAQGAFAENIHIKDVLDNDPCDDMLLNKGTMTTTLSGYDVMSNTYQTKNDGISWHNYWIKGKEEYNACPIGQHVSYYFPFEIRKTIQERRLPVIISEADLASPGQGMQNELTDKDSGYNPDTAADSIRHFFQSETRFGYSNFLTNTNIAVWLLTDNTGIPEHDWHKAYTGTVTPRKWFELWYAQDENWP